MDSDQSGSRRLKSVEQAFGIIEYLHETDGVTVSQAAEDLDIPVSTAHIHLNTLVELGYLIKRNNEYRCSFQFLKIGGEKRDTLALYQTAKPELDDLREETGEHTNVTVEENGYAVQLYKSQSPGSIDDNAPLGEHLHLHSTATGKAMLSHFSADRVDEIIAQHGLPAVTDETITDRDTLHSELEAIRDQGFSINRGEHFPGVCAVGTTVSSPPDDVVGAISISGPISRLDQTRIEDKLAPSLLSKKNIIELKIKQYA